MEIKGPGSLSDAELIAILIRTGKKNKSAIEVAQDLMNKFKGLKALARKDFREILKEFKGTGIGKTKAITLLAAFELGRRITKANPHEDMIQVKEPRVVFDLLNSKLSHLTVEKFYLVILNKKNVVQDTVELTSGVLDSSLVSPREVFKTAIDHRAASIILVHNHPSGNLEPSKEDIKVTQQLYEAGKLLEIPVLDHIIIADNNYTSFVERGLVFK